MENPPSEITRLLRRAGGGDAAALNEAIPHVYRNLHHLAASYLARERAGHTLQATALVNEAWMRLVELEHASWSDRTHFLAVAATCMRRVLVDHARRRCAQKRGGGANPVSLHEVDALVDDTSDDLIALDEALASLARIDARKARLVELKVFAGLENAEAAGALGVSIATVERDWRMAKAWLHRELAGGDER